MTAVVSLLSSYITSSNFPPLLLGQIGVDWVSCERRITAQDPTGITVIRFKVKKPTHNIKFSQVLGPINPAEQNEIDLLYTDLVPNSVKLLGLQDFEHRGHLLAEDTLAGSKHLQLSTQQYIIAGTSIIIDGYLYKVAAVERGSRIKLTTRLATDVVAGTKVFVVRTFNIPATKYYFDETTRRLIIKDRAYTPFVGIYSASYEHHYADMYQVLINISVVPAGMPIDPVMFEVPGALEQAGLDGINPHMDNGNFISAGFDSEAEIQLPPHVNGERCVFTVICRDTENNFSVASSFFIDVLPSLPAPPVVTRPGTYAYPIVELPSADNFGQICRGFHVFRSTSETPTPADTVLLTNTPALDTFKDGPGDLNRVRSSIVPYPVKNKTYFYLIAPAMVSDVWDGELLPAWQDKPEKGILMHKALPAVDEE